VLRLIEMAANKAHENGIVIGICGQLAADTKVTERFIRCKIDELSVPIAKVKATRKAVFEAETKLSQDAGARDAQLDVAAVADGELIPMSEIPDEAFAEGVLGACVGILPENGNVYSPCDGVIKSVADTKHAIVVESAEGIQYLIHMGIETVKLNGEGFSVNVEVGQLVKLGDLIAVMDLKTIEKQGCSTIIITVRL